jgi:hypothetical protein
MEYVRRFQLNTLNQRSSYVFDYRQPLVSPFLQLLAPSHHELSYKPEP